MASATTVVGLIAATVAVGTLALNNDFTKDAAAADPPKIAASAPSTANVVRVVGEDFRFEAPDAIPAGLTDFRFLNKGPGLHHLSILKLTDGRTVSDLRAALAKPGPMPSWVKAIGGPNAPVPGLESNAIVNLAPGDYALICFVDIDGPPHFARGMVQALTVTPATEVTATTVTADASIDLFDYNFKVPTPVTPGRRIIKVTNTGDQVHEVELVQLAPGVAVSDFMRWMAKREGPPPGKAIGGIAGMEPGMTEYFTADFAPGSYALICFVQDAKDGKPHFVHGMIQQITVK